MKQVPEDQNRPADVAAPDSVGGMARRLMNPAHLKDLAARLCRNPETAGRRTAVAGCDLPGGAGVSP